MAQRKDRPYIKRVHGMSKWLPPDIPEEVAKLIKDINLFLTKSIQDTGSKYWGGLGTKDNVSLSERDGLRSLLNNHDIVLTKSDKGQNIVVMDKVNYIREVERQLADLTYYIKIPRPLYMSNSKAIRILVERMYAYSLIDERTYRALIPEAMPNRRYFYVLPKIHKSVDSWLDAQTPPGRPIISDVGTESSKLAIWIDFFLQKIVKRLPAVLVDTPHLIDRINYINLYDRSRLECGADEILVLCTGDVSSLYTNIVISRLLATVARFLERFHDNNRPDIYILRLLELTLYNNDFTFNGDNYRQRCGVAMGKAYSPSLANIYLDELDKLITSLSLNPDYFQIILYGRFIDDIFTMVKINTKYVSIEDVHSKLLSLNNLIPQIEVNWTLSVSDIVFLDLGIEIISCSLGHRIHYRNYFKTFASYMFLSNRSYHPLHTVKGIGYGQILRIRRNSASRDDFIRDTRFLISKMRSRGYRDRNLRRNVKEILHKIPFTVHIDAYAFNDYFFSNHSLTLTGRMEVTRFARFFGYTRYI